MISLENYRTARHAGRKINNNHYHNDNVDDNNNNKRR